MTQTVGYDQANLAQKQVRRFAAAGPGSWLFARLAPRIDRPLYRLTRGRYTFANLVSGIPIVMLTTTGARSGRPRSVPVLGIPVQDDVAVIASNFGQYPQPGWYYNLRAHPEAEIEIGETRRRVRAVVAEGERREQIWMEGLRVYPGFGEYERRAAHRRVTVFVLERA